MCQTPETTPTAPAELLKPCSKCGLSKPLSEFPVASTKAGRLRPECRACNAKYQRERWKTKGPEYNESRKEAAAVKEGIDITTRYAILAQGCRVKPHIEKEAEAEGRLRWYTREEEAAALQHMRQTGQLDLSDLFEFLMDTGCRLSEACGEKSGIQWRDVDAIYARFHSTKNGKARAVPLTNRLKAMLERRRPKSVHGTDRVFPEWNPNTAIKAWQPVRQHLGLADDKEAVLHTCRHTCASRLVQAGAQIQIVQQWLGHKTIRMTLRYAHLAPTNLLQTATLLEPGVTTQADTVRHPAATRRMGTVVTTVTNQRKPKGAKTAIGH
jgi:integrase